MTYILQKKLPSCPALSVEFIDLYHQLLKKHSYFGKKAVFCVENQQTDVPEEIKAVAQAAVQHRKSRGCLPNDIEDITLGEILLNFIAWKVEHNETLTSLEQNFADMTGETACKDLQMHLYQPLCEKDLHPYIKQMMEEIEGEEETMDVEEWNQTKNEKKNNKRKKAPTREPLSEFTLEY